MDVVSGFGSEGAALALALVLAKIIWDLIKQRKAPGNPHNEICKAHAQDILILRTDFKALQKEVADLRVAVAKLNGG